MGRRTMLAALLLGLVAAAGTAPAGAQGGCGRDYCVALPAVTAPLPAHLVGSELRYSTVGVMPVGDVYGLFANDTAAPLCDVEVGFRLDNPTMEDQAGTRLIAVLMPDEIEWRWLAERPERGYSLTASVLTWRAEGCDAVRLTPVAQQVTELDFSSLRVNGSIRNDSGGTVRDPRVRLMPGHNLAHHVDLELGGVRLAPGATASYSQTVQIFYFAQQIRQFRVSAIGWAE